jgi:hypothetical protein
MERREAPGGLRDLLWRSLAIGPTGEAGEASRPRWCGGGASRRSTATLYRAPLPDDRETLHECDYTASQKEGLYSAVGIESTAL